MDLYGKKKIKESNSRKFLDSYTLKNDILLNPKTEVVSQDLVLEFANAGFGVGFGIINLANNKTINLPFASKKFLEYLKKE